MRHYVTLTLVCVLIVPLAACGAAGEPQSDGRADRDPDAKTFRASDVGFTFDFPEELRQNDQDADDVLARVYLSPDDSRNVLKIRQASARNEPLNALLERIRPRLEQRVGKLDLAMERHGDIQMAVLSYGNPATVDGRRTRVRSDSYFFAAAGRMWHLQCLRTSEEPDTIKSACRQALDSIKPRGQ